MKPRSLGRLLLWICCCCCVLQRVVVCDAAAGAPSAFKISHPPAESPSLAPTAAAPAPADNDCEEDEAVVASLAAVEEDLSELSSGDTDEDDEDEDEDDLIRRNPSYKGPASAEKEKSEDSATKKDGRSAVSRALCMHKSVPRLTARFVKKNKWIIVVAAIFAFRRELFSLLWRTMTVPVYNRETGQEVKRVFLWTPTSILKIVLFMMLIWKLQNNHIKNEGSSMSPSTVLLIGRLTGHSNLALILSSFLGPSNPAYLPPVNQHYTFENLNNRYQKDRLALTKAIHGDRKPISGIRLDLSNMTNSTLTAKEFAAQLLHPSMLLNQQQNNNKNDYNSTIIVLDWSTRLDASVSCMDELRDEVSFLIREFYSTTANDNINTTSFEIVILLQSPGGSAADYALAAQQLLRLRQAGLVVTCCVDKVAASGGYMIGCCASPGCLFAAPLAVLGSIGVYSESVNLYRVLEGWGVQPLTFRGGRDKAPLSLIGEVTKEGKRKVQDMVDDTHRAFKRHVVESRPVLSDTIDDIATGDVFLGYDALKNGLIDRIITSDEYIGERIQEGARVLKLCKLVRHGLFSRPTTSSTLRASRSVRSSLIDHLSLLSLLDDFRSLLERASGTIEAVVGDNGLRANAATVQAQQQSPL